MRDRVIQPKKTGMREVILWGSIAFIFLMIFYSSLIKSNVTYPTQSATTNVEHPHRVVVTGAAGFIGSHTIQRLLDNNYAVLGIDALISSSYDTADYQENLDAVSSHPLFTFKNMNLLDKKGIDRLFSQFKPQIVIHLAGRAGVRPSISDPSDYVANNIQATTILANISRVHNVNHFIYASSSSVYGSRSTRVSFRETDIPNPVSPYAASKLSCEYILQSLSSSLNSTALRFFTVYGPRGRTDMAPRIFMDHIARGEELVRYGDGQSERDYTYIDDVVQGIMLTVNRSPRMTGFSRYNIGSGSPVKLSTFISIMEQIIGKTAKFKVMKPHAADAPYTWASIETSSLDLGFTPQYTLKSGLTEMYKWYTTRYGIPTPNDSNSEF